jgi:Mn2+/Fe2+ NRAMP family transporter
MERWGAMSEQPCFLVILVPMLAHVAASAVSFFIIFVLLPFFASIVFPYAVLLQIGKEEQVKRLERKVLVFGAIAYLIYLVLLFVLFSTPQRV